MGAFCPEFLITPYSEAHDGNKLTQVIAVTSNR